MEAVGLLAAMGPWTVPGRGYTDRTSRPAGEAGDFITDKELMRDLRTSSWLLGRSIQLMPGAIKVLADVWLQGANRAGARPKAQEGLDKWLADLDDKYANLKGVKVCSFPPPAETHGLRNTRAPRKADCDRLTRTTPSQLPFRANTS